MHLGRQTGYLLERRLRRTQRACAAEAEAGACAREDGVRSRLAFPGLFRECGLPALQTYLWYYLS